MSLQSLHGENLRFTRQDAAPANTKSVYDYLTPGDSPGAKYSGNLQSAIAFPKACGLQPAAFFAFSLLELLLAMAVIGIMLAIAVPRYAVSATRYHLDAAARRIVSDLSLAQSRARATSKSQPVLFSVAAGTYQITGMATLDRKPGDYAVALAGDPYRVTLVSADFGGQASITFDGYGSPTRGGTIVIQAGGDQRTITVDAATGKAAVR